MKMKQGKTQVSAFIPVEWAEFKTAKKVSWIHILGLGIKALQENPQLITRINEDALQIARLVNRVDMLAKKNFELEIQLKTMQGALQE